MQSDEGGRVSVPRLTVFDDQSASIVIANELSFVQTFEVERAAGAWIADPIVGTLRDGHALEFVVRGVPGVPGVPDAVDVAYRLILSDVLVPTSLRDVKFTRDQPGGTIRIPKIVTEETLGAVRLRAGEARRVALASLGAARSVSIQPVVETCDAGIVVHVGTDGGLDVSWTVAPECAAFTTRFFPDGPAVQLDRPTLRTHGVRVPLGETSGLHDVARRADGTTLAVSVAPRDR